MDVAYEETAAARTLLLATGVVNHRPEMSAEVHHDAVAAGLIRYCPVCDGFEAKDQKIVVLGKGPHGMREAVFLRTYSQDVTLVSDSMMNEGDSRQLAVAGVKLIQGNFHRNRLGGRAFRSTLFIRPWAPAATRICYSPWELRSPVRGASASICIR